MDKRFKFIFGLLIITSILGLFFLMFYRPETKFSEINNDNINTIWTEPEAQISIYDKINENDGNNNLKREEINKNFKNNSLKREEINNQRSSQKMFESEPVKALRKFYEYASSDILYKKAYDMLDENFFIRLGLFKQLGITEVEKADMSVEKFPQYSSLFKTAYLKSIQKEDTIKNNSTILYTHSYTLGDEEEEVIQTLVVTLKKIKSNWVLTSIVEEVIK
jgi:hypothetical protein